MLKNIIVIVSFVLVCGGLLLFFNNNKPKEFHDRNGYATMTDNHYVNQRFTFEMDFQSEWIVYDGVTLLDTSLDAYTREQLEESYGASLDNMEFVMGAIIPNATLQCASFTDYNFTDSRLDENVMKAEIEKIGKAITEAGGTMGTSGCQSLTSKDGGKKMLMYYYDHTIDNSRYSTFTCYANSGEDSVIFIGSYENGDGLKALTSLMEKNISFTA